MLTKPQNLMTSLVEAKHRILALDLMGHTGWACRSDDGQVMYGTETFRSPHQTESPGLRWLRFRNWLVKMNKETQPSIIFFEEVKAFPLQNFGRDSKVYYSFEAHLLAFCEAAKLECRGINPGTIKKFIAGSGKAPKEAVMSAVRAQGYYPKDSNQGDAIALLLYAESELRELSF